MRILRSQAPQPAPESIVQPEANMPAELPATLLPPAAFSTPVTQESEDSGIDELFGSLLDDTTEVQVVREEAPEELFQPPVHDDELEHTQPLQTIVVEENISVVETDDTVVVVEDLTEVSVEGDHEVVVEESVEVEVEDAQIIAERIISAISLDGEVVAAEVIEETFAEPIPSMFGDFEPVAAVPAVAVVVPETPPLEAQPSEEPAPLEESESIPALDFSETPVSAIRESLVTNFSPRPSFDELVFGADSEDAV